MRKALLALVLTGLSAGAVALPGPDMGLLQEQNRIKREAEEKIQKDILDPMLGKGMGSVFVDVEMELKLEREESVKSGMGLAEKYREKLGAARRAAGASTEWALPGIPKPKTISQGGPERPENAMAQQATQVQGVQTERFSAKPVFKRIGVQVMHDDRLLGDKDPKQRDLREAIRGRIVDAMTQYQLQPDQVGFRPMPYHKEGDKPKDWKDDLKRPEVYIPLLFALLTLLFLLWLFGPLRRFFNNYVAALKEKPAAEVNIDSKITPPDEKKPEDPLEQEGKLDITMQRKPDEPPPPPPPEEDEEMKKFEPFAYINEENVKRLAYLFILRKEEAWVIATVLSYLRPDFQRMLLAALPVDMQSRLALEALTVRQVTRDQVVALDADIKENVDFVVGGIERLVTLLDDADVATRNNILNHLKNEKPLIYERVRKHLLVFDDVAGFPDREMQVVVRELKTESMAKALQEAPPEVVNKFLSNMSAGAASLLRESMEYTKGLTAAQVEEERAQIMDVIKVLEKEGKITIRDKNDDGSDVVEAEELSAQERREQRFAAARKRLGGGSEGQSAGGRSPAPAPAAADPAKAAEAQQYFKAGMQTYEQGQSEQALAYFDYALQLDASLWQAQQYAGTALYALGRVPEALQRFEQLLTMNPDPEIRQWVESFKTQVG